MYRLASVGILDKKRTGVGKLGWHEYFDTGFEKNTVGISFKIPCADFFNFFEISTVLLVYQVYRETLHEADWFLAMSVLSIKEYQNDQNNFLYLMISEKTYNLFIQLALRKVIKLLTFMTSHHILSHFGVVK